MSMRGIVAFLFLGSQCAVVAMRAVTGQEDLVLPGIGEECNGTNWPLMSQKCGEVNVPFYKDQQRELGMETVRARCYSTNTTLEASWDAWLEDDNLLRSDSPGIGNFYAGSGEKGRCAIPRKKICTDNSQCRPGTMCLMWKGTSSEFRCGVLADNFHTVETKKAPDIVRILARLADEIESLKPVIAATQNARADKAKEFEHVRQQMGIDRIVPESLRTRNGDADTSNLPSVGEPCNGTDWPRLSKVCSWVSVPVYKNSLGEVIFEKVHPRCYSSESGFEASWDLWLEEDIAANDSRLQRKYARDQFYAASGEQGICALPRKQSCIDDDQCRPGTTCVLWKGTHSPQQWRCGTFWDNDMLKLERVDAISQSIFKLDKELDQLLSLNATLHAETETQKTTLETFRTQIKSTNSVPEDLRSHSDRTDAM